MQREQLELEKLQAEIGKIDAEKNKAQAEHARQQSLFFITIDALKGVFGVLAVLLTAASGLYLKEKAELQKEQTEKERREAVDKLSNVKGELSVAQKELDEVGKRKVKATEDALNEEKKAIAIQQRNIALEQKEKLLIASLEMAKKSFEDIQAKVKTNTEFASSASGQSLISSVDHAKDSLVITTKATQPTESAEDLQTLAKLLFSHNPSIRTNAYSNIINNYGNSPDLVPKIISVAQSISPGDNEHDYNNGIYNALVVLSHMDRDTLRKSADQATSFAKAMSTLGPKIKERAEKLIDRAS